MDEWNGTIQNSPLPPSDLSFDSASSTRSINTSHESIKHADVSSDVSIDTISTVGKAIASENVYGLNPAEFTSPINFFCNEPGQSNVLSITDLSTSNSYLSALLNPENDFQTLPPYLLNSLEELHEMREEIQFKTKRLTQA